MATDSRTIHDFIERVLKLQAERTKTLTPEELRSLALEVGATEDDLAAAAVEAKKRHERGQGHARHQRWGDAIVEFREACALAPHTVEFMHDLAVAYAARWRSEGDGPDRQTAVDLCRRCIEIDASHDASFALLNDLEKQAARRSTIWWIAGAAALIAALGGGWAISQRTPPPAPRPPPAPPPAPAPPPVPTVSATTASTATEVLPSSTLEVDFTAGDSGLSLETRHSHLDNYDDHSFYRLRGIVTNKSKKEIHELKLKLELLDKDGRVVGNPDIFEGFASYEPPMRPGDVTAVSELERTTSAVVAVRVSVHALQAQPAPPSYESDKPVKVHVGKATKPIQLVALERFSEVTGEAHEERTYEAHLEVRNASQLTIKGLKLEVRYLGPAGNLLAKDEAYVVATDDPAFRPGESRLVGLIEGVKGPVHDYQLWVSSWR